MAEYFDREVCLSILRAKANMAVLMGAAPYFEKAAKMLEKLPTVDAVVVTRCKGCKHAYINSFAVSSGEALCTLSGKPMQQDDFCSYGEPKEG